MNSKKIEMSRILGLLGWTRNETARRLNLSKSAIDQRLSKKVDWKSLEVQFILDQVESELGIEISSKKILF
ncbi:hypothetical protein PT229_01025 [Erysipelothrix rhusiopathiae]|uniref:hypothetical protein n=2 Tax=root TaxID=1 RepID=UPI00065F4091|nr:hypothetical protein AXI73_gp18 [Erysipelothrix phage SE-1]AKQ06877.1 hypothetical protein [Erysipelothrix phage SE-1]MDE8240106.1 hypothetical protein [Erysipelothrix rhusiopathiae]MDE8333906.1 hypothetical protein [Erysipelothrix rhusiopathiae]